MLLFQFRNTFSRYIVILVNPSDISISVNESFYFIPAKLRHGVEIKYLARSDADFQTNRVYKFRGKWNTASDNKALANAKIDSRDRRHGKESTNYRSLHSVTSARARISAIKSSIVCCLTYLSKSVHTYEYARPCAYSLPSIDLLLYHNAKTERSKL